MQIQENEANLNDSIQSSHNSKSSRRSSVSSTVASMVEQTTREEIDTALLNLPKLN